MQDKIDFSGLERLTPRADSWDRICTRLDAKSADDTSAERPVNLIPFRILKAIPLAAALVLVGAGVTFFALKGENSTPIPMDSVVSAELSSWYDSLGEGDSALDDYEILDNATTISYLMKE